MWRYFADHEPETDETSFFNGKHQIMRTNLLYLFSHMVIFGMLQNELVNHFVYYSFVIRKKSALHGEFTFIRPS